jgi:hypothetical protein
MMQDKIGLEKLSEDERAEQFWIVYVSAEKLAKQNGYFRETSSPMTETEVRECFEKGGQPASDVEAMFRLAREAYRATHAA